MRNRAVYRFLTAFCLSGCMLVYFSAVDIFSKNKEVVSLTSSAGHSGGAWGAAAVGHRRFILPSSHQHHSINYHASPYNTQSGGGRHLLAINRIDKSIGPHPRVLVENVGNETFGESNNLAADAECRDFHSIPNLSDVCSFIRNTSDCDIDEGFINYSNVIYCKFKIVPLAVAVLFLWWLFLFAGLATTADSYFCPSLAVISKTLRLSQNIAGVTLLALGNGAPDIFSAISAIGNSKNGEAGLGIGALIGAAIFLTTIVAGSVTLISPFVAMERPLLRDITFFIAAVFWTFSVLWKGYITTAESIGYIIFYGGYVLTVIISRAIHQFIRKAHEKKEEDQNKLIHDDSLNSESNDANVPNVSIQCASGEYSVPSEDNINTIPTIPIRTPDPEGSDENQLSVSPMPRRRSPTPTLGKGSTITGLARIAEAVGVSSVFGSEVFSSETHLLPQDQPAVSDELHTELEDVFQRSVTPESVSECHTPGSKTIFYGFLMAVCPIDIKNWSDLGCFWRFFEIFKCPLVLFLNLTMPVVDYDEEMQNWNKILNSLNCILAPIFCVFAANVALKNLGGVLPVWGLALIIGVGVTILVYATSKHTEAPKYHWVFAYIAFFVSIFWIYTIANEIVNLLQSFGVVFDISNAILGLTLLAWGNSIGDLISDTVSARQGFPRMAISACFGGPLLNILLGIGLPFTIATLKNGGRYDINYSPIQMVLCGFLFLSLISTLIIIPIRKFHFTRGYGIYLMLLYVTFLTVAILTETKIIHFEL